MYQSNGGGDVNVPPLPTRRSAMNRQWEATPQSVRHQTVIQNLQRSTSTSVGSELPASSSRLNLAHLDRRMDSSRSRALNDYRDLPTTTTAAVRPGDGQLVSRSTHETDHNSSSLQPPPPLPREIELPGSRKKDDHRPKKKNRTSSPGSKASDCRESIICQRCGRCRCQECARRNPATGRRAVEICSCVSCVRHVVAFDRRRRRRYDSDDDAMSADVCACGPCRSDCRRRWALLVALSVCLPCLCIYWPLRCVAGTCSRCAGRQVRGCRCVERYCLQPSGTSLPPTESVIVDRVTST